MTALAYNLTQTPGGPHVGPAGPAPSGGRVAPKVAAARVPAPSSGGPNTGKSPNWLAPLSLSQIRQQATQSVQSAYAPAFADIKSQSSRAQAIYDKQVNDNHYYLQWLATQSAALQAHNDASNQILQTAATQLTNEQQNAYSTQAGTLIGDANARAGNVSNNAQSNAFGSELAQSQANNEAMLSGTASQELTNISTGNTGLGEAALNSSNYVLANQGKESAALQTTLDKLDTSSTNLLMKQAAGIAAAIATGQKEEVAKQEYAQNYGVALSKLGLTASNDASLAQQRTISEANQTSNANTNAARLNQTIKQNAITDQIAWAKVAQSDKNYNLNVAKFNQATAKDIYERNHGLGPYKPSSTGAKAYLALASQNVIITKIRTIGGEIQALEQQGMSPQDAYHAVQRGYYVLGTGSAAKKYTVKTTESDPMILNAAFNTRGSAGANPGGGGLTQGDVQTLINFGLDPARLQSNLQVATGVTLPSG